MAAIETLLKSKNWSMDQETETRLVDLTNKFVSSASHFELADVQQFSSYFVTHVYRLVGRDKSGPVNFYAKFAYLPKGHEKRQLERIKYEYDYTAQIYDVFKDSDEFDSVEAVGYFEEEGAFVMAEMQGDRLDTLLLQSMKILSSNDFKSLYQSMRDTGQWLAEFQRRMPHGVQTKFEPEQLVKRIDLYLDKVSKEAPSLISASFAEKIRKQTLRTLAEFDEQDFVMTAKHNDFAPWNIMQGDGCIIGFDYADCEFDSKYYDVYHFTRAINTFRMKPFKNKSMLEGCKDAFLEGYGKAIALDHPTRIYFNLFFSLERIQMLLRARKRNSGLVGTLKTLSQRRHMKVYLNELKEMCRR
jgi:hypothetical protein